MLHPIRIFVAEAAERASVIVFRPAPRFVNAKSPKDGACLKLSAPAVDEVDEEKIMNVLSQDLL